MNLPQKIYKFIEKEGLFTNGDRLLCAVSGGIDSMVMLDVLYALGYHVEVAHINYMLRSEESVAEEELLRQYCKDRNIPTHIHSLGSQETDDLKDGNLQQKARDIRYTWFSNVLEGRDLDFVCTAHHQSDVAETFILHALRSSGLKGMASIPLKREHIVRPLLTTTKEEIRQYALSAEVPYQDDSSNLSSDYDRNYIRNEVLPVLTSRWADTSSRLSNAAKHLAEDHVLLQALVKKEASIWVKLDGDMTMIGPLDQLVQLDHGESLVYHILKPYHLHHDRITQLIQGGDHVGSRYDTDTHEIAIDRGYICIAPKIDQLLPLAIESIGSYGTAKGQLTIKPTYSKVFTKGMQTIDGDKIKWPLLLRTWEAGDRMQPLGMSGHTKLLSDILTDDKVPVLSRARQMVLVDANGQIIWLIGHRLSEHVKIRETTRDMLSIYWIARP